MRIFWWIAGILLGVSAGATALGFMLYVLRGEDHYLDFAKRCRHWVIVIA